MLACRLVVRLFPAELSLSSSSVSYLRILSLLCTAKMRKKLLESAPWREEEKSDKFESAKLRATNQPGGTATMYVPAKKSVKSKSDVGEGSIEIDPELRYSFQRNVQFLQRVFSIDTIVKPLPPVMAYPVARNLSFFTRIFTQFFDHEGVANARKSLGLGEEEKVRRVG